MQRSTTIRGRSNYLEGLEVSIDTNESQRHRTRALSCTNVQFAATTLEKPLGGEREDQSLDVVDDKECNVYLPKSRILFPQLL